MVIRHTLLRATLRPHAIISARPNATLGPLSRGLAKPSLFPVSFQSRSFSLWPGSSPKAPDRLASEPTSDFAHTEASTPLPEPELVADIIDPAAVAATAHETTSNWTLAAQILAEKDCGQGIWIGKLQLLLEYLHLQTGWTWWVTITVFALLTRLSLFPILGRTIANNRRLTKIQPIVMGHLKEANNLKQRGDMLGFQQQIAIARNIYADNKCNPARSFLLPAASIPIGIGTFFALRRMADNAVPGLADGGALWFTNLCIPDPYFILPITSALTQVVTLRLGTETGQDPSVQTPAAATMKGLVTVLIMVSPLFTIWIPVAMLVYWQSSNLTGLITSQVFRIAAMRRFFGIPEIERVAEAPKSPSFYDSVLQGMSGSLAKSAEPGSVLTPSGIEPPPTSTSSTASPREDAGQDPAQLRESLFAGDIRLDAGKPIAKRHRGRIEDFSNEFAEHMKQTGGNPWPLPPGISNLPNEKSVAPQPAETENSRTQAAISADEPSTSVSSSKPGGSSFRPPPKSRGYATKATPVRALRPQSQNPVYHDSRAEVNAALKAALEGQTAGSTEARAAAYEQAEREAAAKADRRDEVLRKLVPRARENVLTTASISELETELQTSLSDEVWAEVRPLLRRIAVKTAAVANATTTLEFSSAQMAAQKVAQLGGTQDEIRIARDVAASLAARQKADAWVRAYLKRRIVNGAVDWAPRPPWSSSLESRARGKRDRIFARRFKQERLGRWKRILGWRVGSWDKKQAALLSHQRRWARGTLEEWQERKKIKQEQRHKSPQGRRFEAYRKEL